MFVYEVHSFGTVPEGTQTSSRLDSPYKSLAVNQTQYILCQFKFGVAWLKYKDFQI